MNPKISVLLPVFNGGRFLKESIESILTQTYTDFEILIIDDGSKDDSLDIINNFNDKKIRIIQNKKNVGLIGTLNRGLHESRGEFIARMDQDDISIKDRFEKQIKFFEKNKNYDFVFGNINCFNDKTQKSYIWEIGSKVKTFSEIKSSLTISNCLAHPTVMGRSKIYKKYGYNQGLLNGEDWDLWLRLTSDKIKLGKVNDIILNYRIHDNSMCHFSQKIPINQRVNIKKTFILNQLKKKKITLFELNIIKNLIKEYCNDKLKGVYNRYYKYI